MKARRTVRALNIVAILLAGFLLAGSHAGVAQGLFYEVPELNQQAAQLYSQGRYSEAIPLAQRVLALEEETLGRDHPYVATALISLAELYLRQGRYADAEPLVARSIAIRQKILGPDHPDVATSLHELANLYQAEGRYADAEPLYKRSLAIREKSSVPITPILRLR
jgi:tetratricopeptide (TPR) repeat protein